MKNRTNPWWFARFFVFCDIQSKILRLLHGGTVGQHAMHSECRGIPYTSSSSSSNSPSPSILMLMSSSLGNKFLTAGTLACSRAVVLSCCCCQHRAKHDDCAQDSFFHCFSVSQDIVDYMYSFWFSKSTSLSRSSRKSSSTPSSTSPSVNSFSASLRISPIHVRRAVI